MYGRYGLAIGWFTAVHWELAERMEPSPMTVLWSRAWQAAWTGWVVYCVGVTSDGKQFFHCAPGVGVSKLVSSVPLFA